MDYPLRIVGISIFTVFLVVALLLLFKFYSIDNNANKLYYSTPIVIEDVLAKSVAARTSSGSGADTVITKDLYTEFMLNTTQYDPFTLSLEKQDQCLEYQIEQGPYVVSNEYTIQDNTTDTVATCLPTP